MDKFQEKNADEMSKEEIELRKKEAIDLLTQSINKRDNFLVFTNSKDGKDSLLIGGDVNILAEHFGFTMYKVETLRDVISLAQKVYDYINHTTDDTDSTDILSELMNTLLSQEIKPKGDC